MSESNSPDLREDPHKRFRRLLDEAEKSDHIAASAYDLPEVESEETIPEKNYPSISVIF